MTAKISVDSNRIIGKISPYLFGYFIEHVHRCVYGGLFDEKSRLSDRDGLRKDVLTAVTQLKPAVLRWPGGNFSSWYHWEDGVGPGKKRTRKLSYADDIVREESNLFGTDEYIALCRKIGAEPYITVNAGSGTPEEAVHWVEYCNGKTDTYYANLRRKNGHHKPFGVKFWEIGNEIYGDWQVGTKSVEEYGRFCLEAIKGMKRVDPGIKIVAVGMGKHDPDWDRRLLSMIADTIDYLSVHIYIGRHSYLDAFGQVYVLNDHFQKMQTEIQQARKEKRCLNEIKIALSEWGIWYRKNHAKGLEEIYNLKDALLIASELNLLTRWCNQVEIGTLSMLVNCIAPIFTSKNKMFRQTIYPVLKLFGSETEPVVLDSRVESETFSCRDYRYFPWPTFDVLEDSFDLSEENIPLMNGIPYLDISATTDEKRKSLAIIAVNRHPDEPAETRIELNGFAPAKNVSVWEINGSDIYQENSFGNENVSAVKRPIKSVPDAYIFPAHSVTLLKFQF